MNRRHKDRTVQYVRLLGCTCANPDCESGFNVEGHHVTLLKHGGDDRFWNLVALCHECHRSRYHLHTEGHQSMLFMWKTHHEKRVLGFFMDEQEPGFRRNYLRACEEKNLADEAERLVC